MWHIVIGVYLLAGIAVAIFDKHNDPSVSYREFLVMVIVGPVLLAIFLVVCGYEWAFGKLKGER